MNKKMILIGSLLISSLAFGYGHNGNKQGECIKDGFKNNNPYRKERLSKELKLEVTELVKIHQKEIETLRIELAEIKLAIRKESIKDKPNKDKLSKLIKKRDLLIIRINKEIINNVDELKNRYGITPKSIFKHRRMMNKKFKLHIKNDKKLHQHKN